MMGYILDAKFLNGLKTAHERCLYGLKKWSDGFKTRKKIQGLCKPTTKLLFTHFLCRKITNLCGVAWMLFLCES
jgi:hypothetical protein